MLIGTNSNQTTCKQTPIEGELTDQDLRDVCGGAYLQNGVHIPRPSAGVQSGKRVKSASCADQKLAPSVADLV